MALMVREKPRGAGSSSTPRSTNAPSTSWSRGSRPTRRWASSPNRTGSRLIGSTPNNLYPTGDGELHPHHRHGRQPVPPPGRGDGPARARRGPALRQGAASATQQRRARRDHRGVDAAQPLARARGKLAGGRACRRRASSPSPTSSTIRTTPRATPSSPHRTSDMGSVAMAGVVPRLSATPGGVRHAGRAVGQDTRSVLAELLGYGSGDIAALERSGVIACAGARTEGARRIDGETRRPQGAGTARRSRMPRSRASSIGGARRRWRWAGRSGSRGARPPACSTCASALDALLDPGTFIEFGPVRRLELAPGGPRPLAGRRQDRGLRPASTAASVAVVANDFTVMGASSAPPTAARSAT